MIPHSDPVDTDSIHHRRHAVASIAKLPCSTCTILCGKISPRKRSASGRAARRAPSFFGSIRHGSTSRARFVTSSKRLWRARARGSDGLSTSFGQDVSLQDLALELPPEFDKQKSQSPEESVITNIRSVTALTFLVFAVPLPARTLLPHLTHVLSQAKQPRLSPKSKQTSSTRP